MNANDLPITPKTEPPAAAAPPVSCGVVQDLMPLVRDGVASADSEAIGPGPPGRAARTAARCGTR